jgi:Relaxase/Mobilisation nuclease domain
MIGKQFKGKVFYPVLAYALGKQGAKLIGSNMANVQPVSLAKEFDFFRRLNPAVDRCMYHASLSLPPPDHMESADWHTLAQKYLQQMGFDDNQYVVVRHCDRAHDHVHIIASRIKLDGSCVSDSWDHYRIQAVIRELEQEFNLAPVESGWEKRKRQYLELKLPSIGKEIDNQRFSIPRKQLYQLEL